MINWIKYMGSEFIEDKFLDAIPESDVRKSLQMFFINKLRRYEDEMIHHIGLCKYEEPKAIYRRAALRYKTKALIVQDNFESLLR